MSARFGSGPGVLELARGKWRGILLTLGVNGKYLNGKNGPCPQCEGVDRFRFTDFKGDGSSICNQCGSLTGMQLVQALRGWDFATAAREIENVLGKVSDDPMRPTLSEADRREMLGNLWKSGKAVTKGDPVDTYLTARGVGQAAYERILRYVPFLEYAPGISYPAMIALVEDVEGKALSIHRTWLDGECKAPVDAPRKMMPGSMGKHGTVRLRKANDVLGVAEGIETAYAASRLYQMPVWAALNAGSMAAFIWPERVKHLHIFGDNDDSLTGHAAAYALGKRARSKKIDVTVHIPPSVGQDFNDIHMALMDESRTASKQGPRNTHKEPTT